MAIIVSAVGVAIVLVGLLGMVKPRSLSDLIGRLVGPTRFWVAVVGRLALGAVFLAAAPQCRLPLVVQVVGVIMLLAALGLVVMGQGRLDSFVQWWLGRSTLIRLASVVALAFGVLLTYAGA